VTLSHDVSTINIVLVLLLLLLSINPTAHSRKSNTQPVDYESDALTVTLPVRL